MNAPRPGPSMAGLALIGLTVPGLWIDARLFLGSWLVAWWWAVGLMLGAQVNVWIHRLSGGRWGRVLRRPARWAAARGPLALLLFVPLATGLPLLYPWAQNPQGWADGLAQPGFVRHWFQPAFVGARLAADAVLAWALWRPAVTARPGRAAAALALYLVAGTQAAVDLLMSLVPGWYSTAFGVVVLSGQVLGGTALCTLWLALHTPQTLAARDNGRPPLARDIGNLLLMWLMLWAYLAFMAFLIIWAEDLPHEIAWYLPRLQTGWAGVGLALAVGLFALPLLALLQRRLKDRPAPLAAIAAGLLLMQLLNSAWLVLPSVDPHAWLGWWLVPQLALGMGLLLFGPTREVAHGRA